VRGGEGGDDFEQVADLGDDDKRDEETQVVKAEKDVFNAELEELPQPL
jgi:hypothetical protein